MSDDTYMLVALFLIAAGHQIVIRVWDWCMVPKVWPEPPSGFVYSLGERVLYRPGGHYVFRGRIVGHHVDDRGKRLYVVKGCGLDAVPENEVLSSLSLPEKNGSPRSVVEEKKPEPAKSPNRFMTPYELEEFKRRMGLIDRAEWLREWERMYGFTSLDCPESKI